jgi:hypothetical protein
MRISKGAFNVNCSTTKEPSAVVTEMFRALDQYQVQYKQVFFTLISDCYIDGNLWPQMSEKFSKI